MGGAVRCSVAVAKEACRGEVLGCSRSYVYLVAAGY